MRCTVSLSSKPTTCHIPTVLGTCTTGSWWPVWATLSCPAEGSCATSSSTSEGKCPFHLQPVSLYSADLLLPIVVTCLTLLLCKHLPVVFQPPTFAQFLPPAVLCIQTPPLATHLLCQKDVECKLPKQNTVRLCCSGFAADDLLLTNGHVNITNLQERWGTVLSYSWKYVLPCSWRRQKTYCGVGEML